MSKFSDNNFVKKLTELNNTQQCIQTLSLWLIHHRKHSKTIVEVWYRELVKVPQKKRLTFLYLANDVVQNSKKKGPEFIKDFQSVLPKAYSITRREADEKTLQSMQRMVTIWRERTVFPNEFTEKLIKKMEESSSKSDSSQSSEDSKRPSSSSKTAAPPPSKRKKHELSLKEELEKSGLTDPVDTPEVDVLTKSLEALENAASSDAVVREKIAALPKEVVESSHLDTIKEKPAAETLSAQVDEACKLLEDYNSRLNNELEDRKTVSRMLQAYITHQKDVLTASQKKLEEYQTKFEKVSMVRRELTSHIQSLPDLTLLPDVTGGLAPLPSAGDLFNER